MNYVGYIRVSTQKQGLSGLGLDAQQNSIDLYLSKNQGELLQTFTEVESGKKADRPQLLAALELAKEQGAKLVIAKLDRLSRNLAFIAALMDSGVDFVCCDMPDANKFTIHIFAALAQQERELISQRTKAALAELKKKGKKLGSPQNLTPEAIEKASEARKAKARSNENNRRATELIVALRPTLTFQAIADRLNNSGYKTATGKKFTRKTVQLLCLRNAQEKI